MKEKFNSAEYWEKRYEDGGNSGPGSYGRLAKYKATFLNNFVKKKRIKKIVEFGVGDGSQLSLAVYPRYLGLDVSQTSIAQCIDKYESDKTKSFFYYSPFNYRDSAGFITGDLCLSLDVIFHLVEEPVYEKYMYDLFNASVKYVIIYASNKDEEIGSIHVRHRKFTDFIDNNLPEWRLVEKAKNPYEFDDSDPINTSFADFYVFKKK